MEIPG
jgi:hypothetical protein